MKTIEEIEKEYESYPVQTEGVSNLAEFLAFIEVGLDDTDEYEADYAKELRENKIWKIEAMIRNFFFFIFEQEETDIYDDDSEIVEKCIEFTGKYRSYFERIRDVATEENVKELVRLVDFTCDYYSLQMDYYDYLRDQLEYCSKGFQVFNPKYQNCRPAFDEFMEKKIGEFEAKGKKQAVPKEYVKKAVECHG